MNKAKWIWGYGEFELYHNMMLNNRRIDYGLDFPSKWHVSRTEANACFYTEFEALTDTVIKVVSYSKGKVCFSQGSIWDNKPLNKDLQIKKGKYKVFINLFNHIEFPSVFIDSEYLKTDESWKVTFYENVPAKVGCEPEFTKPTDNPAIFPFSYKPLTPISVKQLENGTLYDFGNEYFGPISLKINNDNKDVTIALGESEKEALTPEKAIIHYNLTDEDFVNGVHNIQSSAFRYIFVTANKDEIELSAQFEYLPIEDKGSFSCDNENIEKIWKMCVDTFHLNSREVYLDGIKRDRWVWSGDAYQSFMVNRYLYNDPAIIKRTIISLLGKRPYKQHINTINEYSGYLIISVLDYYYATGDVEFVKAIWDNLLGLYEFIVSRLNDEGYVYEYFEDWVFIDWANIDKFGAVCAEQIILWQVYNSMAQLSSAIGCEDNYSQRANELKEKIYRDYWNEEKGAFIDSYESGKNHVSRHQNIFAILYDFVDNDKAKIIAENVLYNDHIDQITTPYFKLYELLALCKMGDVATAQNYIDSYWGGMLELGATTVWEEFNPNMSGDEHYAMYGAPFGKSLCHAWGSGPILILGQYVAGVTPTSIGSKTFDVAPNPANYKSFNAIVPINDGTVTIEYNLGNYKVTSTVSGGTLVLDGKEYLLTPNKTIEVNV